MKNRRYLTVGGLVAAVAIFLLINTAGRPLFRFARLDLTQNKVHTLSKGTVHILETLQDPVKIQLYWSAGVAKDMTSLKLFSQRVLDLLEEYSSVAGGKLTLEVIDPEPFSEAEDDAVRYGLQGVPTGSSGETLYFGIVGFGKDGKHQVIPFLQPARESFLEFDLSRMVYSLDHPEKTKVGLLSALPLTGGPSPRDPFSMEPPWIIVDQLQRQYDLKVLPKDEEEIPDNIGVLMVVYPQGLAKRSLYAIDQFVLRGGHALVFVDPMSELMAAQGPAEGSTSGYAPNRLLGAWGVKLTPGKVVGDMAAAQRVSYQGRFRTQVIDYLPWLAVRGNMLNRDEVVTGQIDQLNLASAGSLTPTKDAGTKFVPLVQSTSQAMLLDRKQLSFPPDPKRLIADFKPAGKPFTLAGRISGPATTAFPDGPPPPEKKDKARKEGQKKAKEKKQLLQSKGPINVIVVADTDLLQDRFWVTIQDFFGRRIAIPNAGNADFAINALDQLSGSSDLISIRSRGTSSRPFTLVEKIRREAEQKYRAKEQELTAKLDKTERKLNELQGKRKDAESAKLTPEQQKEIDKFRQEKVDIRKDLRVVQYQLRRNIEKLETMLKFINIALVPILVALGSIIVWFIRRKRNMGFPA